MPGTSTPASGCICSARSRLNRSARSGQTATGRTRLRVGTVSTPLLSIGKTSGPAALKATSAPHGGPTGPCRVAISSRSPSAIRLVDNVPAEAPAPALPRHPGVSACVRVRSMKPFSKLAKCRKWPTGKLTMIDVPASKEPSRRGSEPSVCVEGTLSQGIRAFGLRKCRYFGLAKTSLQEILAATAMNMIRAYYWFAGRPLAKTRLSSFAAMYKPAV
jgi:hypothetical protein